MRTSAPAAVKVWEKSPARLQRGRHGEHPGDADPLLLPLDGAEEERPVLDDRPAHRAAENVPAQRRFLAAKKFRASSLSLRKNS